MFRIIHPNRWFFWTIAIAIGLALFLLWAIMKTEIELYSQTNVSQLNTWRNWSSETLGISVRYPAGWQIEIDPDDAHTVFLENPENYNENVSIAVRQPQLEAAIRLSLKGGTETKVSIGGTEGRLLKGADTGDQATNSVVLVRRSNKLYYIAGSARVFEQIVNSIKFID